MLDRDKIFRQALHDCFVEMYKKSQPSADYDDIVRRVKAGEEIDTYENPVHNRHYLSMEEFDYIRKKYIDAYRLKESWTPNLELLEDYFINGGTKDAYIDEHEDEYGVVHGGYRGYEKVHPFNKQLDTLLKAHVEDDDKRKEIVDMVYNATMENISACKNFFSFDREESSFSCATALGASPCSNKDTVINYWKSQGVDLEIVDRNPMLLWEMDYYGENFEEVMTDEYGEDWENYWWQEYHEEQRFKAEERERKLKECFKQNTETEL